MDKSGIFVGVTLGSISIFIIMTVLFIIPAGSDETAIQMQDQMDQNKLQVQSQIKEINNLILRESESKTLSLIEILKKLNQE